MDILKILTDYWQYIAVGISVIFDIILIIVKRRPRGWDALNDAIRHAIEKLPSFISSAEDIYLTYSDGNKHGLDKKNHVLAWCYEFICNYLHRDPSDHEELYIYQTLSHYIEQILETPQKKGEDEE
jgi:hypothetical protein